MTGWLQDLLNAVPDRVRRVIDITLGESDPEFEQWIETKSAQPLNKMKDSMVAKYACEFASVPISVVRRALLNDRIIAERVASA